MHTRKQIAFHSMVTALLIAAGLLSVSSDQSIARRAVVVANFETLKRKIMFQTNEALDYA